MGGTLRVNSPWRDGLQQLLSSQVTDGEDCSGSDGCLFFFDVAFDVASTSAVDNRLLAAGLLPSNFSVLVVDDLPLNRR